MCRDLAADLAQITFDFPFKIPPYFALIIRAISVLEGIALLGNPGNSADAAFSEYTFLTGVYAMSTAAHFQLRLEAERHRLSHVLQFWAITALSAFAMTLCAMQKAHPRAVYWKHTSS